MDKRKRPVRGLWESIERLCEVAVKDKTFKNGREFADYVLLMATKPPPRCVNAR